LGKGNEGSLGKSANSELLGCRADLCRAEQNPRWGKNAAGAFVKADLASVTAAAGAATEIPDDFRVSITNAPGKAAYPISSFTWLLIPAKIDDAVKRKSITDFLHWMLTDGQKMTEALDYAQLPKPIVAKEMKAISKIQ
jgi:phosphate transport system substrate-binding protein